MHYYRVSDLFLSDFDVHHGNGTEVCVENLVPNAVKAKFSIPLHFGGHITLTRPSWKPWLTDHDEENVFFCSVHGFGKAVPGLNPDPRSPPFFPSFYPGSGKNHGWLDSNIVNYGQNSSSRQEWRHSWRDVVLPRLRAFHPDLIIISAGFDAHAKDSINGGFCSTLEQDYEWITQMLVGIANETCEGRIVSVLEGGYRIQGMCVSAFARSVAEHVKVLAEAQPSASLDDTELEFERANHESAFTSAKPPFSEAGDLEDIEENNDDDGLHSDRSMDPAEEMEVGEPIPVPELSMEGTNDDINSRPKRKATRDIDFVKLNEQIDREHEAKRQKNLDQ